MSEPVILDLEKILADALAEEYESWDKEMRIWPSDLGIALGPELDGCPVEFWMRCRDEPRKKVSPGQMLMFKMGDLMEEYLVGLLERHAEAHGWRVISSQESREAFGIRGRSDVTLEHIVTGVRIVVDIKTKRGNAFRYLNEPKPGNVLQVQHYVAAADAVGGVLLYADREGQNFVRQFDVPREDERPEKAVEALTELRDNPIPPDFVPLRLKRRRNKGADSVYIETPWQMEWCSLKTCACREALPKAPPSGIAAKVGNDGLVTHTEGNEAWLRTVVRLLRAEYPDEKFHVDGDLFPEPGDE